MPKIFISYRRDDSAGHAGRLYDRLVDRFGQGQVFMDVDAIRPGLDFVEVVQEAVGSCDALIAVIGREWLGASDDSGRKRLEKREDLVRLEIATALERDIRVIPVLVQGARMPVAPDLPEGLKALARRNSVEVSDNRFRTDIEQLIRALEAPATGALADTVFVEPAQSLDTGFVGRERELGELNKALEDTLAGRGRLVMLVGEPGIGKTRTAQELASHAEAQGAYVLWGRCLDEEGAPPYWPWLQPLRTYVQQADPEQLRSEMGPGIADIAEIVSEIRRKLPDLEAPSALQPEQARFRLFDSITTFLKNTSQTQPLMLVLDDLHWADKPSLLLLQFLAREMGVSRLLVVGTYRDVELSRQHPLSETLAQLSREPVLRRVLLRGLSQENTEQFIETSAGIRPSPGLVEGVYSHTEGNPFFMTEVIRLLSERNELTANDIGGTQGIRIPEGVREVIGQRLNRLSQGCNRTLTIASVIGREFSLGQLSRLLDDLSDDQLLEALEEAVATRVIEELPGSVERYQFAHALIRETLSSELSATRRVRLHARIGQALEELYATDIEGHASELAHHFTEAETVLGSEKLVRYSLVAGDQALSTYAYEETLVHLQRALKAKEGQPTDADTAAILFGLGRAHAAMPHFDEAIADLSRAFESYAELGDLAGAVAVAEFPSSVAIARELTGVYSRALDMVSADSHQAGRIQSNYGYALGVGTTDYHSAREALARATSIARREKDLALEMRTLANAANAEGRNNYWQESLDSSLKAIKLSEGVDDLRSELLARVWAGYSLVQLGRPDEAQPHSTAMLTVAEKFRAGVWIARAYGLEGILQYLRGEWADVRSITDRAFALSPNETIALVRRALLEYELGNYSDGDSYVDRLVDHPIAPALVPVPLAMISRISGTSDKLATAQSYAETTLSSQIPPCEYINAEISLGLIAIQRDDAAEAVKRYGNLSCERGMSYHAVISIDRVLGLLAQTMLEVDKAVGHFEEALAFCRKAGYRSELAWTCCDYADTLLQRNETGDREKAIPLLDESLAISSELGMRPLMERALSRRAY